jgi:hypothetical protein
MLFPVLIFEAFFARYEAPRVSSPPHPTPLPEKTNLDTAVHFCGNAGYSFIGLRD